jgi:hypothetical protein
MKTVMIQGVPFTVSGESVYIYGTSVQIGTYNGSLSLKEGWESDEVIKAYLSEYRTKLHTATKAALAKAAELQLQQ